MPASVRIENLDALSRARVRLADLKGAAIKVAGRAASTLRRRMPAFVKRDIGTQYNLPSRDIGSRLRCNANGGSVTLKALGRNQTLIKFKGARQNKTGVTVAVEKGRPLQIAHAFVRVPAGAPGAGPQVLIRVDVEGQLPDGVNELAIVDHNRHGYPIALLGGPSVADMLRDGDREDRAIEHGREVWIAEIDRLTEKYHDGK